MRKNTIQELRDYLSEPVHCANMETHRAEADGIDHLLVEIDNAARCGYVLITAHSLLKMEWVGDGQNAICPICKQLRKCGHDEDCWMGDMKLHEYQHPEDCL